MTHKHEKTMLLAGAAVIMLIGLANLFNQHSLNAINDEFAYWANAAMMAGKDWTALLATGSFYSYGYSFLLVPLFLLGFPATLMYRIALVYNVIFLVLSFLITVWLAKKLFGKPDTDCRFLILLAFVITLYPYNIYQMHLAWTESLLCFLFWAITALMYRILSAPPRILDLVLVSVLAVYIYTVHNRALGITMAVFFMLLIAFLKKIPIGGGPPKRMFRLLPALFLLLILFIIASVFRQYTINHWYLPEINATIPINDYSGQTQKIARLLTLSGFVNLLLSLAGKLYYQATTTFLLALLPLVSLAGGLIGRMKREKREKWDAGQWLFCFCIFSYLLEIGIAALFKTGNLRNLRIADVIYGRYPEFAVGPALLFGFAFMLFGPLAGRNAEEIPEKVRDGGKRKSANDGERKSVNDGERKSVNGGKHISAKIFAAASILYLFLAALVAYQLSYVGIRYVNPLSGVRYFFRQLDSMARAVFSMTLTALLGFALFLGFLALADAIAKGKLRIRGEMSKITYVILNHLKIIGITLIGIYWLSYGYNVAKDYIAIDKARDYQHVAAVNDILEEWDKAAEIYYVTDIADRPYRYPKILQSLQPDRRIHLISLTEALESLTQLSAENAVLISGTANMDIVTELRRETELLAITNGLVLYAPMPRHYKDPSAAEESQ